MIKSGIWILLALCLGMLSPATAQCAGGKRSGQAAKGNQCQTRIAQLPKEALTPAETAILLKVREEEKMARDAYQAFGNKWNGRIFATIAQAEQRHMNHVKALLDKYSLTDPVTADTPGSFTDPDLRRRAGEMIRTGSMSLVEALRVAARHEDRNIKELRQRAAATDNQDIRFVLERLAGASGNHLRAFVGRLSRQGITYEPAYLKPGEMAAILTTATPADKSPGSMKKGSGQGCAGAGRGNDGCAGCGQGQGRQHRFRGGNRKAG